MTDSDEGRFVFTRRPAPVSPRLRPGHRIALLLEMVDKCWGGKATLIQLHALDTALVDPEARKRLTYRESAEPFGVVRVDPALNWAVDRAVADGVLKVGRDARVQLTDAGHTALEQVRQAGVLQHERAALSELRGKLTQTAVRTAVQGAS